MTDTLTDNELIKRCLSDGDRSAWETFVRRYSRLIWNSIHKTFLSYSFQYTSEDVEDMYSAVFLSLVEKDFKKLKQFRGENSCAVSTWLTVVVVRMTIDFMRKDKRHHILKSDREDRDIWESIPDAKYRADTLIEEKQEKESLEISMAGLSPRDKMICDLLFNKGFSPEETAETLGLTPSAVYSRKHRIIGKIKKAIKDR